MAQFDLAQLHLDQVFKRAVHGGRMGISPKATLTPEACAEQAEIFPSPMTILMPKGHIAKQSTSKYSKFLSAVAHAQREDIFSLAA